MALIGLSIAVQPGNSRHSGPAHGYVAFGSAIAVLFILFVVVQVSARLTVAEHGITWGSVLHTRSLGWAEIQDVLIVPTSGMGTWYRPAIRSGGKLIRIQGVAGSHRYIECIVTAISVAQRRSGDSG